MSSLYSEIDDLLTAIRLYLDNETENLKGYYQQLPDTEILDKVEQSLTAMFDGAQPEVKYRSDPYMAKLKELKEDAEEHRQKVQIFIGELTAFNPGKLSLD